MRLLAIVPSAALLVACAHGGSGASSQSGTTTITSATSLTDGEVAAVVVAANDAEVQQAQLAEARASAPVVRRFADHMMADHNAATQKQTELLQQLGVQAKESSVSRKLDADGRDAFALLAQRSGEAFDRVYMQTQVREHERVLALLRDTLIPNARTPELHDELEAARAMTAAHLREARAIVRDLSSTP